MDKVVIQHITNFKNKKPKLKQKMMCTIIIIQKEYYGMRYIYVIFSVELLKSQGRINGEED